MNDTRADVFRFGADEAVRRIDQGDVGTEWKWGWALLEISNHRHSSAPNGVSIDSWNPVFRCIKHLEGRGVKACFHACDQRKYLWDAGTTRFLEVPVSRLGSMEHMTMHYAASGLQLA